MSTGFHEKATELLRSDPTIRQLEFDPERDINWYGKGADHNDLLQVTRRDRWMVPATDAEGIGYEGVWVHYESCRPGHWCIHCELYPRLDKEAKAAVTEFPPSSELKRVITEELRTFGEENDWAGRFGAHTKHARRDLSSPSSLIVWTFDLGLETDCSPESFAKAVVPVIAGTAATIDEFVCPLAAGS